VGCLRVGDDSSGVGLQLKTSLIHLCCSLLGGFRRLDGEGMVQVHICQVDVGLET